VKTISEEENNKKGKVISISLLILGFICIIFCFFIILFIEVIKYYGLSFLVFLFFGGILVLIGIWVLIRKTKKKQIK